MNENEIKDVNPHAEEIKNLEAQIAGININDLDPNDNGKMKTQSPAVDQTQQVPSQETQNVETQSTEGESNEDPIKAELDRIKGDTNGKSAKEKFEYKLRRELAQAKEMGIDVTALAGIKTDSQPESSQEGDDDKPLTRRELEEILKTAKPQSKSAMEMALEIENEAERELHLYYLENKVRPSGNAEEDFQTAKAMVNAIKLQKQVSLSSVKPPVQTTSSASSFQPRKEQNFDNVKLTPMEEMLYKDAQVRGVPLTKEEIIKMRG